MIKQLQHIFSKKQQCRLWGYVFLLSFGALLDTAATALMYPLMKAVVGGEYVLAGILFTGRKIAWLALAMGFMYVSRGIYRYFINKGIYTFKAVAQTCLTDRLFRGYLHRPYLYHLHKSGAEIQQSVTQDVSYTFAAVMGLLHILSESLTAVLLMILLLCINPLLTLLAGILIISVLLVVNQIIARRITTTGEVARIKFVQMLRGIQQGLGGLKSVKANRREDFFADNYARQYEDFSMANRKYALLAQLPRLAVETGCMAGCFVLVAVLLWKGVLLDSLLPSLATFALAAVRLMPAANRVNSDITRLKFSKPYVQAVYSALQETAGLDEKIFGSKVPCNPDGKEPDSLHEAVEAIDVSFQYPEQTQLLFSHVNLRIPAGKSVALTGPTGIGKTTLADLFLGLLVPRSGVILADGRDISQEPQWWARRVGYVPQQIYLTEGTLRDNVAFGVPSGSVEDDYIWKCLEDAGVASFVRTLPQGLDTKVGERGMRISGGQRQRIGIARALYIRPQFLVLDEATSSLDTDTEQVVMEALTKLSGKMTLLVIAHRQTTVQKCDYTYSLSK